MREKQTRRMTTSPAKSMKKPRKFLERFFPRHQSGAKHPKRYKLRNAPREISKSQMNTGPILPFAAVSRICKCILTGVLMNDKRLSRKSLKIIQHELELMLVKKFRKAQYLMPGVIKQ